MNGKAASTQLKVLEGMRMSEEWELAKRKRAIEKAIKELNDREPEAHSEIKMSFPDGSEIVMHAKNPHLLDLMKGEELDELRVFINFIGS